MLRELMASSGLGLDTVHWWCLLVIARMIVLSDSEGVEE